MLNKVNRQPNRSHILSKSVVDKKTYDKIQRHLRDINDTITEDDIRNIKIGMAGTERIPAGKEEKALLKKEMENNESTNITDKEFKEGRKINSTWNIIEE